MTLPAALESAVLLRFQVELAEAGPLQLDHLAQRAEGNYCSACGRRMRELVDLERSVRERGLR